MTSLKGTHKRQRLLAAFVVCAIHSSLGFGAVEAGCGEIPLKAGQIQRLTFSKDDEVMYPSMDARGKIAVYRQETIDAKGEKVASIRVIRFDGLKTQVIYTDGMAKAPAPHEGQTLVCGTKPPLISGNGQKVIFTLSLGNPLFIEDHYLAVADADGSGFRVIAPRNEELARRQWERWGFTDDSWRTVSQYRISHDGTLVACLVKGHMGAREIPMPSGIVLIPLDRSGQRTLLAPKLQDAGWAWEGYPRRPSTGGGWVFDLSADRGKLLFGAQSSEEKTDYDLYTMSLDAGRVEKITDFRDRWFVRGEMSGDGNTICFFYSGKKQEGIGSYALDFGGDGLALLRSQITDRVDFEDMSGDGKRIFHRVVGRGLALIEAGGGEFLIFDERRGLPDLKQGVDFPYYPSFWSPGFVSWSGDRLLLEAIPMGKDRRELFLLRLDLP